MAGGATRKLAVDLPPEAEAMRDEVRQFAARTTTRAVAERHRALLDAGYLFPHWPKPWGRGAGAVEQIVIDEELAGIDRTAGLPITAGRAHRDADDHDPRHRGATGALDPSVAARAS